MKIRRCPVGSFFFPCSWRNVKEWIKGQFSVNFLVNFVFLDLSSQVISDVFSSGSQPLKDRNERDRKKKKDVNLSWLFASACKLDSRQFLSICKIKKKNVVVSLKFLKPKEIYKESHDWKGVIYHFPDGNAHIWMLLLRLPKALAPTLVGTKLLLPIPPDRLRKSARRWVTQVAVLQPRFCAVTLLQENRKGLNEKIGPLPSIQ